MEAGLGFRQLSADEPVRGSFWGLFFILLLIHERKPGSLLWEYKVKLFCILCALACACEGAWKPDCKAAAAANAMVKTVLLIEQGVFGEWLRNL